MTPQPTVSDERPVSSDAGTNVAASAGVGVLAAAIGYLATYLLIASEVRELVGDDVAAWTAVAWFFYNAHLVDVEASGSVGSFGGTETVNLIAESGSANADLLYVLPPLVLLGAGALLAVRLEARDLGESVVAGAPVAIGYAVVMGLGAVVAEASSEGTVVGFEVSRSIAPPLLPAIVLGGVLYPLVFATGGAVLAVAVRSR